MILSEGWVLDDVWDVLHPSEKTDIIKEAYRKTYGRMPDRIWADSIGSMSAKELNDYSHGWTERFTDAINDMLRSCRVHREPRMDPFGGIERRLSSDEIAHSLIE